MAYAFWRAVEDKRIELQWTKTELSERTGLPRSTFNDLQNTTRPPQPRIVHAYADAVGIDRTEAERLAGLRPQIGARTAGVREAILASDTLTTSNKRTMIELFEQLSAANRTREGAVNSPHPEEDDRSDDARRVI